MNPDSAHGCGSDRAWCDPESADNDHQCPWRPQHLNHMLATFEQKPFGYNEVIPCALTRSLTISDVPHDCVC